MTRARAVAAGSLAALFLAVGPAGPADAVRDGEWTRGVATVHVQKTVLLNPDATVTVRARLKCEPEWQPSQLDARVTQGEASAEGYTVPSVPCDDHWHEALLVLPTLSPAGFHPGRVDISIQFLLTHVEFGDFSGAHDQARGRLVPAG